MRRVFADLVDREETKSDNDYVVHDKVRLDQIYGINNGMAIAFAPLESTKKPLSFTFPWLQRRIVGQQRDSAGTKSR